MHESALGRELVEAVLRALPPGARPAVVRGHIGETEALSLDSLRFHFQAHARGTAAEGAELDLDVEHIAVQCTSCNACYRPEHHLTLCPACGGTEGRLLGRTGVYLEAVVLRDAED